MDSELRDNFRRWSEIRANTHTNPELYKYAGEKLIKLVEYRNKL